METGVILMVCSIVIGLGSSAVGEFNAKRNGDDPIAYHILGWSAALIGLVVSIVIGVSLAA